MGKYRGCIAETQRLKRSQKAGTRRRRRGSEGVEEDGGFKAVFPLISPFVCFGLLFVSFAFLPPPSCLFPVLV
jgi:hypothetical protein